MDLLREYGQIEEYKFYLRSRTGRRCVWIQFKVKKESAANHFIINELFNILDEHKANRDKYRVMAYEKAIDSIRNYPHKIRTATEARALDGIGKGIAAKIGEILQKTPPRNYDQHYRLWHNKPELNGRRRLTY